MSADFLDTSAQGRLAVRIFLLKYPNSLSKTWIEDGGKQTSEYKSLSSSLDEGSSRSSSPSLAEPVLGSGVSGIDRKSVV